MTTVIKDFINETHISRTHDIFTSHQLKPLWAILVAIFAIGGICGALLTGVWSEKIGRKRGMMVNCWLGVVAAALMFASYYAKSYEMIIVGRLIIGFHCGLYTGLVPVYLSEISYARIRGALGTLNQFGIVTGILVSQILGFPEIMDNHRDWSILLGLTGFPAIIQFVLLLLCPESPKFLISHDKCADAEHALVQLRGTTAIGDEIQEILDECKDHKSKKQISILGVLGSSELRWPLTIAVIMQLSQQLSGINAINYYSSGIFEHAGLSDVQAQHMTSGVGAVQVIMTAVSVPLMDRAGRRPLHLTGLVGMFIATIVITVCLALRTQASWLRYASIVVLFVFIIFFSIGPGSIPWLVVSELFTYAARSSAISIAVFVNWLANFAVGFVFPFMQSGLQDYVFLPFSGLLLFFIIFIYKFFPETKNRTIVMITADLMSPVKRGDSEDAPLLHTVNSE